jgi:hypothetical protein
MKTGRSSAGDRRQASAKDIDAAGKNWEQQVDYPVPPEGGDSARTDARESEPATREDRIRLGAYLRAQQRGFNGNNEMEDWLAAEREVDSQETDGDSGARR